MHTRESKDGVSSLQEIIIAAKRKGLDGLAVTDHDIPMSKEHAERVTSESGLIVVPGIEVSSKSGHVILLCPKEQSFKDPALNDVVKVAKEWGCPLIIPHPADPLSHGIGEEVVRSIKYINPALEVLNASTFSIYNHRAKKIAEELCLYEVGGSDAHVASAVGSAYTLVDVKDRTTEAVVEALTAGKTRVCGGQVSVASLLELTLKRVLKIV